MILHTHTIKTGIKKKIHTLKPTLNDSVLNSSWLTVKAKWFNSMCDVFRVISSHCTAPSQRKTIVKKKIQKTKCSDCPKNLEYPNPYYIPNKKEIISCTVGFG